MRVLRIDQATGLVLNAEEWDEPPADTDEVLFRASEAGGPGWTWEAGTEAPVPPPEPDQVEPSVPKSVSMRQARLALLGAGLLDTVEALISGQPRAVQIEWGFATDVWRDRDLVATLGSALSLSDAQIDALFIAAKAIP